MRIPRREEDSFRLLLRLGSAPLAGRLPPYQEMGLLTPGQKTGKLECAWQRPRSPAFKQRAPKGVCEGSWGHSHSVLRLPWKAESKGSPRVQVSFRARSSLRWPIGPHCLQAESNRQPGMQVSADPKTPSQHPPPCSFS